MAAPTKSAFITNLEAAKQVFARPGIGGRLRVKHAFQHTIPFTGSAGGDVHRLLRFHSGDILHRMYLYSDGGSTAGVADVGLYLANDGAVIDADLFASAWPMASATTEATAAQRNYLYESTQLDPATESGEPLWEVVGRGVGTPVGDPLEEYDLCLTMTAAATVADSIIGVEVFYTAGD